VSIRRQPVESRAMDGKSWNDSESESESENESELFLASPNFQHPRQFSASMETSVGNTQLGIGRKLGFISSSHLLSLHFFNKGVAKDYVHRASSSLPFKWEGDSAHIATRRLNSSLAVNYLAFLHPCIVRLLRVLQSK
jgi:hypothetical protein